MDLITAIATSGINVAFFAVVVYFDILVLFPKYMKDRKMLIHFGTLAAVALLLTPIKTTLLYFVTQGDIEVQSHYLGNQLFTFFTMFFVAISATIYGIMNDWLLSQRQQNDLMNQSLQSELKFLKSQINPHFLFNTLNSLYALTLKKSDLAPEIVLKLSEMMRYMLYECNEKTVSLKKEINYMQNYIELEKLRHGDKLIVNLTIEGNIEEQKIAPLVLIPFIENSFKHGLNSALTQGFVDLNFKIDEDDFSMTLENSKTPSMPKTSLARSGGIGLINVSRRMAILYPDRHHLNITDSPKKYKVEIKINLSNLN